MAFNILKDEYWWEYRDFDEEDRSKIEGTLTSNNRKIVLTSDFYDNMAQTFKSLGVFPHPMFKRKPDYRKKEDLVDPELGTPLGRPEPISEDVLHISISYSISFLLGRK
jgi:hypothetical protein